MLAMIGKLGLVSGLRAVRPSLLEVRTSAGLKSVSGMSPGTSVSDVQLQD